MRRRGVAVFASVVVIVGALVVAVTTRSDESEQTNQTTQTTRTSPTSAAAHPAVQPATTSGSTPQRAVGGARTAWERSAGHVRVRRRHEVPRRAWTPSPAPSPPACRCWPTSSRPTRRTCSHRSRRCSRRRPRDGQPGDRDHRARRAGAGQELPLPFPGGVVHRAEGRRRRRGQHGEQPLARLRTCRHAGHVRRDRVVQAPRDRDRPRRRRGVPAVSHRRQGPAHRDPQRARLAGARADPGWSATDTQPGVAFSIDRTRLLEAVAAVRPDVDTLVVFLHWGTEETHCASAEQQDLAAHPARRGRRHRRREPRAPRVRGGTRRHLARRLRARQLRVLARRRRVGAQRRAAGHSHRAARSTRTRGFRPASPTASPSPQTGDAAAADIAEWEHRRICSGLSP